MKRFFKYIILRIVALVAILFLLDVVFTTIYTKKKGIRNKVEFIFQNEGKTFDYVFLGSSRVEYHVDTDFLNKKNTIESLNLGISGQDLPETFLMLKLLIEQKIKAKKYFIHVDESDLTKVGKKPFTGASYFMPYIKNNEVKNHFKKYDDDFVLDTKMPFYRYMNYGYKIGYRELLLKSSNNTRKENFFIGLKRVLKDESASYVFKDEYKNGLLNEIKTFAKEQNIELVFFTSPYYNSKKITEFQKFAKNNNITHYVDSIKDVKYFKDSHHLNNLGARRFTKMLMRDFDLEKH